MRIVKLTDEFISRFDDFLIKHPQTLLFNSNKYRLLLKNYLHAEDHYFLALDDNNEIVGALPTFILRNNKYGNILNSLPFFGSNGGIIEFNGDSSVREALLTAFYNLARDEKCLSSTIITSPFEENNDFYKKKSEYRFIDKRIGQVFELPDFDLKLEKSLMGLFHSKTRNMVRKALKSDISIYSDNSKAVFKYLFETHEANLKTIKGTPKQKIFFELIPQIFTQDIDFKIWIAEKDGIKIAALLVFYFNKTVEYFTPVIVEEYRSLQPLSLIIYEAMKDAIGNKYKWWNFGGTWLSQDGVYHFKQRWGSEDRPYFYYTKIFNQKVLDFSVDQLKKEFPYFYVFPYGGLTK